MKTQVFNPFLPPGECIPDGEPHVFGDRVYLYGSHDKEGGETFCMLDYTVYSAPVDDLSQWRCEGVIYRAEQDPDYPARKYMYAPDAVRGNDGRYYLYYCMSGDFGVGGYFGPISVAVCGSPAGKFEYLGYVRNKDGSPMKRYVCFDPAVLNDNGVIRLYYGTQYDFEEREEFPNEELIKSEMNMFGKTREEILEYAQKDSVMGAVTVTLESDMLTIADEPRHIIPYKVRGTGFAEHPFFEASSMRKVGEKYYFIYSSQKNHELCYAVSDYPDRDFKFGGTIISNGDVGLNGRRDADRLNMTGTTHGSIEKIGGEWYVFYHRLTHKSDYSRQACAEKISVAADGSIAQVEMTSCGLNGGALRAEGTYPAVICCNLTNGHMPHGSNKIYTESFPNCTHSGEERFIGEICGGTVIGYKYFEFEGAVNFSVRARSKSGGRFEISDKIGGTPKAVVEISPSSEWREFSVPLDMGRGVLPVFLRFVGESAELVGIGFN
ncbi:MAG: family 43 glycosylhydrolase [Ruminococcus sp.]|nr:family 43 glycosylhydrolase [Ruminococcus sp.]MCM1382186.1 family 43 glycosylhydrolase [Muribaculaceae bacterium]MCM1480038.1 family 43 glycosylhydrolase [Muribaculaceae bacterium]